YGSWLHCFGSLAVLLANYFSADLFEVTKATLWAELGCPRVDFPSLSDAEFSQRFELEWEWLKNFSGLTHDFVVRPAFSGEDMVRYTRLRKRFRNRRVVNEMIDHVALRIWPAVVVTIDHVHPGRFRYWARLLLSLMDHRLGALVREVTRKSVNRVSSEDGEELLRRMRGDVHAWATQEYNFWYGRMDALAETPLVLSQFSAPWGLMLEVSSFPTEQVVDEPLPWFPERDRLGWVRPSEFLRKKLRGKYLGEEKKWGQAPEPSLLGTEIAPYQAGEAAGGSEADEAKQRAAAQDIAKKRKAKGLPNAREIDGELCVPINFAAAELNRSAQILRKWEKQGKIRIVWWRTGRGKRMRWVPVSEVDRLRPALALEDKLPTDKEIARVFACSASHIRDLKKRRDLGSLPRLDQVQKLYGLLVAEGRKPHVDDGGDEENGETPEAM
ncbi:hypothetical protein ACFL09_02560, partial [Planctomycetota bacterium]